MHRGALALALVVVLAGCVGPAGLFHGPTGNADPPTDVLGWEAGYWYDEPVAVTSDDGLNDSELDAVVARTMARVERIRQLEFEQSVSVEVISRAELRERWGRSRPGRYHDWSNQVYEALFLVDEATNASAERSAMFGASVVGFYAPGSGHIVLVSGEDGVVQVDRKTLAHELVHALQDQQLQLNFGRSTMDGRTGATGLVEGDANYVMQRYEQRCSERWDCLERPGGGSGGGGSVNQGLFLTAYTPYSDGPSLVAALRDRGGWAAVNAAYENPPASSEQVVHPDRYPDDEPATVAVPDRSGPGWHRMSPSERRGPRQVVGEASIFAMLWVNGVVPEDAVQSDDALSPYNYSHPASAGWEGDVIVPYRSDDRFGYVFRTEWETDEDARQFRAAYVDVLRANGAVEEGDGVYRIPEGEPYADAFRVVRNGTTVTVVNAPTVDALDAVHDDAGESGE
jgi:hypothetical protein